LNYADLCQRMIALALKRKALAELDKRRQTAAVIAAIG